MLQPILNSNTLPLLEKVAAFAERRHEVLAGNIANIDTPGYKTRDLPVDAFQNALKESLRQLTRSQSPGATGLPRGATNTSLSELFPADLFRAVESASKNITFQDGANRSVEHEVMELTKNSMLQSFVIELMTAQMNLLQSVISERP